METVFCPVANRQVTDLECFDISFVAEGSTPERFMPSDVRIEDPEVCLKCEYHPK